MSLSRSTPKRSPPSAHRLPPLFIPDSPLRRLSKLTLEQVAELTAHTSNSSADTEDIGGRWSIPIFLAGDVSSAGRVGASPQLDGDTPRQLLFPPTSCGDEDETVGLLSSQVLDTCTPRRLSGTGPRTPVAGRSPVVDRKVSAGSTDTDEETWSPPSPSDLVYQSANTRDILADGTVFARRNRHARGPQDSIWRHCSPLKSTSDPDPSVAADSTLFDPGYSLVTQSSANLIPRGASPFDLSEDEGQRLMPRGLQPRCPSPLDSTFMAVLSRPPFNAERASFTSRMAAQAAQKGELRLVVWMEYDNGRTFSGALPFRRYIPPAMDLCFGPADPGGRVNWVDRFGSTGCVEYAARAGSSSSWAVQSESAGGPSELRLVKITLSDDDHRNFVASSMAHAKDAPRVSLDDFGTLELIEGHERQPQWVLRYEIGVDSEDTTITLLSFTCHPDLLDRSQATVSKARSGGAFRLRISSASDASPRLSRPLGHVHSVISSPEATDLNPRPAASKSKLMLLRSPSKSLAASLHVPSSPAPSTFSLFDQNRSLNSVRTSPASAPPTIALRRSHSLRSARTILESLASGKLLARDAPSRSSAPLPFVPSSGVSTGQDGALRVRSSPGQGLPPGIVSPPSPPPKGSGSKRRPATGSPSKGATAGLSAKHFRRRHVTASPTAS